MNQEIQTDSPIISADPLLSTTTSPSSDNSITISTTSSSSDGSSTIKSGGFKFGSSGPPLNFTFGSNQSAMSGISTSSGPLNRSPTRKSTVRKTIYKGSSAAVMFEPIPVPDFGKQEPSKTDVSLYNILQLASNTNIKDKIKLESLKKDNHIIQIKTYERDLLSSVNEDLRCYAFKPFLKVTAPSFYSNCICNERLLRELNEDEVTTLNSFIQCICNQSTFKFKYDNVIFALFLVDMSGKDFLTNGDCFVQYLTFMYWNVKNALDIMEKIEKYMSYRTRFFPNIEHNSLLEEYRHSCLELIGANSSCKEFDMNVDPRVKKYVMEFYQFKKLSLERSNNHVQPMASVPLSTIYNKEEDSDVIVEIPNSEGEIKTIYCHKTVLSSVSEVMEVNFQPNWNNEEKNGRTVLNIDHLSEVTCDPSAMEYILAYVYGAFSTNDIPSKQVIPLIQLAHFYRIHSLLDECLYLCLNKDRISFFEIGESLEYHFDDLTMKAFEDFMLVIGSTNYSLILGADDEQLMRLPKRLLIKMFRSVQKVRGSASAGSNKGFGFDGESY